MAEIIDDQVHKLNLAGVVGLVIEELTEGILGSRPPMSRDINGDGSRYGGSWVSDP